MCLQRANASCVCSAIMIMEAGQIGESAPVRVCPLEVQRNLRCPRARSNIVRTAERRQEVIQGILVGDVDGSQVEVDLVVLLVKDVVFSQRCVKKVAMLNAGWVVVVVACAGSGNIDELRS